MFNIGQKVKFISRVNFQTIHGIIEGAIQDSPRQVYKVMINPSLVAYVEANRIIPE
jgi:hypothetical protein